MFKDEFIGLYDYSGKPLFEGDIIRFPNQDELGVILYDVPSCQFRISFENETTPSCSVGLNMTLKIGSIYDNPTIAPWAFKRKSILHNMVYEETKKRNKTLLDPDNNAFIERLKNKLTNNK